MRAKLLLRTLGVTAVLFLSTAPARQRLGAQQSDFAAGPQAGRNTSEASRGPSLQEGLSGSVTTQAQAQLELLELQKRQTTERARQQEKLLREQAEEQSKQLLKEAERQIEQVQEQAKRQVELLEAQERLIQAQRGATLAELKAQAARQTRRGGAAVSATAEEKLDKILDRLERLEKRLDRLEKPRAGASPN